MKINILFEIKDGPWGGGNQFLKSLKKEFISSGLYEEEIKKADIVLFNSFQEINEVIKSKKQHQDKIFVHRVDGPISLVRGKDLLIDKIIFKTNEAIADATVFQSEWSKKMSKKLGMKPSIFETTIYNSPDKNVFSKQINKHINNKIKLVASSWSDNPKKGFDYYKYLDENLNFEKYEMIFIGRSPIQFKNIKMTGPLNSLEIAKIYRDSDIYVTATKDEPCSNALIEALSCGLPVVYLKSGGNPELVLNGGESFENKEEIIKKIEVIMLNYNKYLDSLPVFDIKKTAKEYLDFFESILKEKELEKYIIKNTNTVAIIKIDFLLFAWIIKRFFIKIKSLIWK